MENIKIALITADRDFGRALGLALVDVYRNFTVTLYQSVPVHNELDTMDLVLSDTKENYTVKGKYIYLTEKNSQIDKNYEDKYFCLYKYSNARQMAGEMLFIYGMLTGRKAAPIRNVNARIVLFGASCGGCGCTSASMGFAREMRRKYEKKVMYLSLEEVESTLNYMERVPECKSVSDYLYYLLDGSEEDKFPFLESYILTDPFGVDAFMPSPGRNVMKSLSTEEMQYFIGAVLDTGGYDYIVIDAGCSLEKNILTCYEMANNVFWIYGDAAGEREDRCMEYILYAKGEKVTDKIKKVILPYENDSFYMQNDKWFMKPEGKWGKTIKSLVEETR